MQQKNMTNVHMYVRSSSFPSPPNEFQTENKLCISMLKRIYIQSALLLLVISYGHATKIVTNKSRA